MNKISDTVAAVDDIELKIKSNVGLADPESPGQYSNGSDTESLDLVRKILLGDQMRKAERQQASMERHIHDAMEGLNKEMQQQVNSLRKDLKALEQKTGGWRHDMLTHIEQADRQVQQHKMDRQGMADLLRSMARQLTEQETKPATGYESSSFTSNDKK